MAEKATKMVIRVDLGCQKCHKKIRKVLCKIPQIQNQTYDEKSNTVTITVVCCSPERVKDKICCKAGEIIWAIEIIVPPPKEPEKPPQKPKQPEKPKEPETGPCYCYPSMPLPCYGRPVYDSWGGGWCRRIYLSRCYDYDCEENPNAACIIM